MRNCGSLCSSIQMIHLSRRSKSYSRYLSSLSHWLRSSRAAVAVAPSSTLIKPDWDRAMSNAEKVAGYRDSYFSLRCLLSDEVMNVALHLRKLSGIPHPLFQTAKQLSYITSHSVMQIRGLVVLLIAKSAASMLSVSDKDKLSDILRKQTSLAEMTEIINHAYMIHSAVLNIRPSDLTSLKSAQDLHHVNKMSVLLGDFLLASVMKGLGEIRNTKVVELMSIAISDYMEGRFLSDQQEDGNKDAQKKDAITCWEEKNFLTCASLQANSCQSVLFLGEHDEAITRHGYEFGKNFALALTANQQLQPFIKPFVEPAGTAIDQHPYTLMSAPVMLHMENSGQEAELFQALHGHDGDHNTPPDYRLLHHYVNHGKGIDRTKDLIIDYSNKALKSLDTFDTCDSVTALRDMVIAIREV